MDETKELKETKKSKDFKMAYCPPQDIPWPMDKYGITSALKDAVIRAASRTGGHADKKATLDETMKIARAYIEVKFARESKDLKDRLAKDLSQSKPIESAK